MALRGRTPAAAEGCRLRAPAPADTRPPGKTPCPRPGRCAAGLPTEGTLPTPGWQDPRLTPRTSRPLAPFPAFFSPGLAGPGQMRRQVAGPKDGSRRVPVGSGVRGGATRVEGAQRSPSRELPHAGTGLWAGEEPARFPPAPARWEAGVGCVSPSPLQPLGPLRASARVCAPVRAGLRVGSPVPLWAPAPPRCRSSHAGPFLRILFSSFVSLSLALTLSGAPAVPSRAAGCWEVAWLPLRCCCARGGREGGREGRGA